MVGKRVLCLFRSEVRNEGAPSGSTPMILVCGERALNTVNIPEIKPPPPTGTKR